MPLTMKYLDLPNGIGARGGINRFFMLAHGIPFTENLVALNDWGATEKERLVSSGENPCGGLPVIYHDKEEEADSDTSHLIQHVAVMRYLARLNGITKDNTPYEEYVQDLVADEYHGICALWVTTAFYGSDDDKTKYKTEQLPKELVKFDKLYGKYKMEEVYLSVSKTTGQPLWGDTVIFGLLRDNILTGLLTPDDLKEKYPNLNALYETFGKIEAVKAWIDKH